MQDLEGAYTMGFDDNACAHSCLNKTDFVSRF